MPTSTRFDLPRGPQLPLFLGEAVRARRRALGLTQQTLAERCDIDREQVGRVERGVVNTTVQAVGVLAVGLQTYPDELMRTARIAWVEANPWYAEAVARGRLDG